MQHTDRDDSMSGVLSRYTCQTCGHNFKHESQFLRHQNKKNPCLPPGQSRFQCAPCDATFPSTAKLEAHLRSRGHIARIEEQQLAAEGPAIQEAQPESSTDQVAVVPEYVPIKPLDFGKCDNDALDELEKLSGKELMTRLSINPGGCGFTPFAKLFRVLFLDDKVPSNVNVLMEGQGLDSATYYFRQGHWRESDCPELTLEDCLNTSAVQMSNITHILARVMHHTALDNFERVRETIERQTSRGITRLSKEVLSLLQAVNLAIVRFTKAHPELLAHAKADAEAAPRFRWMQKTRDLPTWQIGGAAWKRNAKFLETGQWVNPTWDDE
jgi:hypothetical protein